MDPLTCLTLTLLLAAVILPPDAAAKWVKTYGRNRKRPSTTDSDFNTMFEDMQEFDQHFRSAQRNYYEPSEINNVDDVKYSADFGKMGFGVPDYSFGMNSEAFETNSGFDYGNTRSGGSSTRKQSAVYETESLPMTSRASSGYDKTGTNYVMGTANNGGGYGRYGASTTGGGGQGSNYRQQSGYGRTGTGRSGSVATRGGYANTKVSSGGYRPKQQRATDYSYPGSADNGQAAYN